MKGSAKAAGRSKDEAAGSPEAAASEDDHRIRALILAELDRRDVRPVARRTLALIAEGFVEPAEGVPGYRIVDRAGAVRLRDEGQGAGGPLTLHDLVEELRAQHAPLFLPPAPEPEPEPARDTIADVRAAGARFVETQSALARSLATTSAERSRALASAASETVEGWRSRLATRLKAQARPAPDSTALGPEPGPGAAERLAEARARFGQGWQRVAGGLQPRRTAARLRHLAEDAVAVGSHRPVALLAFGALAGAGLVVALSLSGSRTEDTPAPAPRSAETPTPPVAAGAPASNRAASNEAPSDAPPADAPPADAPGTNADAERQAEPEPPRKGSNALTGVPEVIDTATLRVGGKVVRLFGVEWVRGGQADELSKYLRKRTVSCQPAAGSSAFVCTVEGRDLSEVVLFNGGGRASSEATPDLVAAEDHARTERLGVWKR